LILEILKEVAGLMATLGLSGLMFTIGLTLTVADFTRIIRYPLAVSVGLIGQIILLPLVAFCVAILFQLSPALALGLMIIAACPGGPTSNAFSMMAKGDLALSVTLTAISSVIAFITVPTIVNLSIGYFGYGEGQVSMSFIDAAYRVFVTTALPVMLGMVASRLLPREFIERIDRPLFVTSFVAVLLPSIALVINQREILSSVSVIEASSAAILNVAMTVIGLLLGVLAKLTTGQTKTISIEVGIQNFGLAFVIIHTFLDDVQLLVPGIAYLPTMFIVGFSLAYYLSSVSPVERTRGQEGNPISG